jgi:hypothetical protein
VTERRASTWAGGRETNVKLPTKSSCQISSEHRASESSSKQFGQQQTTRILRHGSHGRPASHVERLTLRARRGRVTTLPKAGQQRTAQAGVAACAARGDRNIRRAGGRFVSERVASSGSPGRWPGGATCHCDHGRHGAGHGRRRVTAPGHGGHGAGHGATHDFHCPRLSQDFSNPVVTAQPTTFTGFFHSK